MSFSDRLGAFVVLAVLTLATGCSGASTQPQFTPQSDRHSTTRSTHWYVTGKPITSAIFVSDVANSDINVFSFPKKQLIGTIGGLSNPQGIWIDAHGNLWVANTGASAIYKYVKPWNGSPSSLSDPGMYPTGVTVDSPGNCYAANFTSTSGGAGNVVTYPNCKGTGTVLNMTGACAECASVAVDPTTGNVWAVGNDANLSPIIGYWGPGGKGSFTKVNITPGSIAFDRHGDLLVTGSGVSESTVSVYPPPYKKPNRVCDINGNISTIALGTVQKRLFTVAPARFSDFPILRWPGCTNAGYLIDQGSSEPLDITVYPMTN